STSLEWDCVRRPTTYAEFVGLDNRELASLIGLGVLALVLAGNRKTRRVLPGLVASITHPKVFVPVLALLAYTFGLVVLGTELDLWDKHLLAETAFWVAGPGLALLF